MPHFKTHSGKKSRAPALEENDGWVLCSGATSGGGIVSHSSDRNSLVTYATFKKAENTYGWWGCGCQAKKCQLSCSANRKSRLEISHMNWRKFISDFTKLSIFKGIQFVSTENDVSLSSYNTHENSELRASCYNLSWVNRRWWSRWC